MKRITIYLTIIISLIANVAFGQTDSLNIRELSKQEILKLDYETLLEVPFEDLVYLANQLGVSIDELLNMNLKATSKSNLSTRETPGIVTIISKEDIEKYGFRDLIDVFQVIPGFSFGYDIDAVIGLSARGNWGHEGKILVLVDGQEFNEGLYSTSQFGNHFSVDQIEKIEIIRGPGSSIYGGYAELGVVNIITKNGEDLKGAELIAHSSISEGKLSRKTATVNIGNKWNDFTGNLSMHYNQGFRAAGEFTDFYGDTYDMADGYSDFQTVNMNLGLTYKDLQIKAIYDDYAPVATGYENAEKNRFNGLFGEIKYNYKLNKKFSIQPKISYKNQTPYWMTDEEWFYQNNYSKTNFAVDLSYEINDKISLIAGVNDYYETAKIMDEDPEAVFYNNTKGLEFNNIASYIQGTFNTKYVNVIFGGRYDYHSLVGSNLSPRIGLTKIIDNFHYKLLYSGAFRSPSIENINLNQGIKPERTNVIELELGYKLNDHMFLTTNLFNIRMREPIVYTYDNINEVEIYENFDKTGTSGIELEYLVKYYDWSLNFGYSYYTAAGQNSVPYYAVETIMGGDPLNGPLQAAPQNKFNLRGLYQITDNISLATNVVYLGKRYGFVNNDLEKTAVNPTLLINPYLLFQNVLINGLSIGVGAYNLLNKDYSFIQPYGIYESVEAPYPGRSREFTFKVAYKFQ